MGWNLHITLDGKTGAAHVLHPEPVPVKAPDKVEDANLRGGIWLYTADDDEEDIFDDFPVQPSQTPNVRA
jgi:hypothetical protein